MNLFLKKYTHIVFFILINVVALTSFSSCQDDREFIEEQDPNSRTPNLKEDPQESITPPIETLEYIDKSCATCDFVIGVDEWQFDGSEYTIDAGKDYILKPGDTIGISGDSSGQREGLNIKNVNGTKENPIVFINCNGRITLGSDKNVGSGITIQNSTYFKIAGTGSQQSTYGIALRGYMALEARDKCSDLEVFGVEVLEAGYAGIICRTDAACDGSVGIDFTQYNTILHHNKVQNTGGEGFYVGGSHWNSGQTEQPGCVGTLIWEPELKGVKVYANYVKNTGRDGIQVGSAVEDSEIFNNTVVNYGLAEEFGHLAGVQINPGTTGKLYNNRIYDGKGYGIFCVGQGENLVYNNLIVNAKFDAIYSDERLKEGEVKRDWHFKYFNNTIIKPGEYGFNFNSNNTVNNEIKNNIVLLPKKGFIIGWENYEASNNIFTDKDTLDFVNPEKYDYTSKKAISGLDLTSFGITTDILGRKRPKEGKVNAIGAF